MRSHSRQRGATATLLAGSMVLLLGVAAVVIDLSAGFVERNRDQGAADNAVMAGALDKAEFLPNQTVSASVLTFAKSNLRDRFGTGPNDALWVELWRSCVDSGNLGWVPLPEPAAWAGVSTPTASTGSLDCISQTSSLLRVRIPDQLTETTFGKAIGAQSVSTNAVAIAKAELNSPVPPIVPFGISGAVGPGELCFNSSGSGTADAPCTGPSSGTFGTILSELFGDFYGTPSCANPTSTNSVQINTSIGVDHLISEWPNSLGQAVLGSTHPGDTYVLNTLADTNRDSCDLLGGHAVPTDGIPLNTLLVDTGFSATDVEVGLVSNTLINGTKSRLQRWDDPTPDNPYRSVVARRTGGSETLWVLDNRGPWAYLTDTGFTGDTNGYCRSSTYTSALPSTGPGSKQERFNNCIAAYVLAGSSEVIFDDSIQSSPRFVWAPQYWYALPATGLSWEPIYKFRMAFLGGVWFKAGAPAEIMAFYPDEHVTDVTGPELCIPSGSGCKTLNLWQIAAWYLPDDALPASVRDMLIGPANPRVASLWE
jgi:Putative Flp pilus-assembly TadE/G-like